MSKVVRVVTGYSGVPLPDGNTYNSGQSITLTDAEYNSLIPSVKSQLVVIRSVAETVSASSTPDSSAQQSYTNQLVQKSLIDLAVPVTLTWDGSDYQPTQFKSEVNRQKTFIGPVDPSTVTNVGLSTHDVWINA